MPAVRGVVRGLDPQQPIFDVTTLERLRLENLGERRAAAATLAAFAAAALLLAALGLYGVLAFAVRERTGEIGVRMALGAGSSKLIRLFVLDGLALTLPGAVLGLALASLGVRLLEGLFFGVTPTDPLTYAVVTAVLIGVGLVACAIPAWRATRIDPLRALRSD